MSNKVSIATQTKEEISKTVETFLETWDESAILAKIEAAQKVRHDNGMGNDILKALENQGIAVKVNLIEKPFYKSKKFWGGMIALVIIIIDRIEPSLDIWQASIAPLTYVFGQGLADLGKNRDTK